MELRFVHHLTGRGQATLRRGTWALAGSGTQLRQAKELNRLPDQIKVSLVSAACLIALVVVLKQVLHVGATVLSRDIIIYIVIYSFFPISYLSVKNTASKGWGTRPLFWNALVILMTLAIILIYAV